MQEKETIQTQSEDTISGLVGMGNRSTLRSWITPTFERIPLKDALSNPSGTVNPVADSVTYYS